MLQPNRWYTLNDGNGGRSFRREICDSGSGSACHGNTIDTEDCGGGGVSSFVADSNPKFLI
ncbi:hypothetical protein [Lacihabitans lacunae]|uniref:Uncharacterized protein n=1 Tax=Lacihabitans lacunae TaxID=1028214 RepID=A0ABV7Z4M9_9BACT